MCCVVVVFFIQNKVIIYLLSNLNLIYHHFLVFNFWSDLFLLVFSEFYFSNSTENLLQLVAFVHQNQCVTQFARQELFHEIDSQNGDLKLPKHDQVLRSRELKQHERILRTSFILLFLIFFRTHQNKKLVFFCWVNFNLRDWSKIKIPPMTSVLSFEFPDFNPTFISKSSHKSIWMFKNNFWCIIGSEFYRIHKFPRILIPEWDVTSLMKQSYASYIRLVCSFCNVLVIQSQPDSRFNLLDNPILIF